MKNQDESTTYIQLSYRTFTIFESFFYLIVSHAGQQKSPFYKGLFLFRCNLSLIRPEVLLKIEDLLFDIFTF
jgi:hypothetical protein